MIQVIEFSNKVDDLITMEKPSGYEDGDKKNKAKLGGKNKTQPYTTSDGGSRPHHEITMTE